SVDTRVLSEPGQGGRERLAGDAMQGQRDRIQRTRDEIGARPDRFQGGSERVAGGTLAIETNRQPARLSQRTDQLVGAMGLERARRIVEEDADRPQLGQLLGLLDEILGLAGVARTVDKAGVE